VITAESESDPIEQAKAWVAQFFEEQPDHGNAA
jgi:hypothetical protein